MKMIGIWIIGILFIFSSGKFLNRFQWDVTEENLYTLSDASVTLVSRLDSNIKLKLFYSKVAANKGTEEMRGFNSYFEFVRDFCSQLSKVSGGRISVEVIDPRPNTIEEDQAISYGLKKFNLSESESYFFGLVADGRSEEQVEIIPFLDPNRQEKLEYELVKLLSKFSESTKDKKKIGVFSSIDVMGKADQSWLALEMLKELYSVKKIPNSFAGIEELNLLILIHPKDLDDSQLYLIDQYVLRGGRVLLMVDPHSIVDRAGAFNPYNPNMSSNLPLLMKSWGIELIENHLVGDLSLAASGKLSAQSERIKLLPVIKCDHRCTEGLKEALTEGLDDLSFYYPGALRVLPSLKDDVIRTILAQTTSDANIYKANFKELNDPSLLLERFIKGNEKVPLAFKIMGRFKSAIPALKGHKTIHLEKSEKSSAVIVFSDVDFISNQVAFSENELGVGFANDNAILFLNSVEELLGNTLLMKVRSKGRFNRSFDLIDSLEMEAWHQTRAKSDQLKEKLFEHERKLTKLESDPTQNMEAEKKNVIDQIVTFRSELREIRRQEREKIETIGTILQYFNTLFVPILFIIFGLFIYFHRQKKFGKNYSEFQR